MTDAEHRPAGRVPVVRDLNVRAKLTNENEAVQNEDKKVKKTEEVKEEESAQKPVELDKNLDEMKEQEKDQQREILPKPLNPSPAEETDAMRKEKIREMMRSAWVAYRNYSWGANELKPIAKT
uniref:Uncharacterized protein n=1 Tax=Acrobeloides nanus TaxID=290746 RepID=A0A914E3Y5_9BILA